MLNKFVIGALTAGAIAVPLAGVAAAQTGNDTSGTTSGGTSVSTHANAGIGTGGLPGRIGAHFGAGTNTTITPPNLLGPLVTQAQAAGQSLPQYLRGLTTPFQSPGQLISGIAHGVFPSASLNLGATTNTSGMTNTSGILGLQTR